MLLFIKRAVYLLSPNLFILALAKSFNKWGERNSRLFSDGFVYEDWN